MKERFYLKKEECFNIHVSIPLIIILGHRLYTPIKVNFYIILLLSLNKLQEFKKKVFYIVLNMTVSQKIPFPDLVICKGRNCKRLIISHRSFFCGAVVITTYIPTTLITENIRKTSIILILLMRRTRVL